tara:strand:+ start:75385 stop:76782 length:1398 start_codon:yes stop_codon:yes gene_type:complete
MSVPNDNLPSVLFVAFNYPPYANVGIYRTLRFTRYIGQFGWKPMVLTCAPDVRYGRLDEALLDLIPDGIPIRHVPLVRREEQIKASMRKWIPGSGNQAPGPASVDHRSPPSKRSPPAIPKKASLIRRKTTEVFFGVPDDKVSWKGPAVEAGLEMVRERKPRAVFASGPPFTTHLVAREIARRANLPLILDFRDPWSRAPWGARHQSRVAQRMVTRLESRCVHDATRVILNTQRMQQEFQNFYTDLPNDRFAFVSNGFDPEMLDLVGEISNAHDASAAQDQSGDDASLHLLHPGSLYRNRDPRPLLDAIEIVRREGIRIIFEQLGPWDPHFQLPEYAERLGIRDQLRMSDPVPHREMLQRMAGSDAFLLLQPGTDMQIPGKLFEMLLFRKPILALADPGSVAELISSSKMGAIAPPNDTKGIATSLRQLHEFRPCDAAWKLAIEAYDGRKLSEQLGLILDHSTGFR